VESAPIRLAELAAELGRPCEGNGELAIAGVAALEAAGPGELAFVGSPRWAAVLTASRAAAVIAPDGDPRAAVASDARVDPRAAVGPGCFVGAGARMGADTVLHANVALYPGVRVGADCELHAGCVLRE
jgi:UDP-3-O-[3-hydroxymyristoyl] glucosamine N-acyltransferase